MPTNESLQPDDFPLAISDSTIVTRDGGEVAITPPPAKARYIVERLNEDACRRHEEDWSA